MNPGEAILNVGQAFPVGAQVSAYVDEVIVDAGAQRPIGPPVETAVVSSDGILSFTGLLSDGTGYVAAAQLGGAGAPWTLLRFTPEPKPGGGTGAVSSVAGRIGDVTLSAGDILGLDELLKGKADVAPAVPKVVIAESGSHHRLAEARTTFLEMTDDCIVEYPSSVTGDPTVRIVFEQDDVGDRILTLPPNTIYENGAEPVVLSTAPGAIDVLDLLAGADGRWLVLSFKKDFHAASYSKAILEISGLVLYARHGKPDKDSNTLNDLSPAENNGTYTAGTSLGVAGALAASGLSDALDLAVDFLPTKSASIPDDVTLDIEDTFTWIQWIEPHDRTPNLGLFEKGDNGPAARLNAEGFIELLKKNKKIIAYSNAPVPLGKKSLIVLRKNGATVTMRINGLDVSGTPGVGSEYTLENTASPLTIGVGGNHVADETVLVDRYMSDAEVERIETLGLGPQVPETLDLTFEDDFTNWSLAGVGEGPAYPKIVTNAPLKEGAKACEVNLQGSQSRAELIVGEESSITRFQEGDHVRFYFSVYIFPGEMLYGHPGAHNIFCQLKSDGEGSPLLSMHLWDYPGNSNENLLLPGKGKGLWLVVPRSDKSGAVTTFYLNIPFAEGEYHDIIFEFKASLQGVNAGSCKFTVDGEEVWADTGIPTIAILRILNYLKVGLYRNGPNVGVGGGGPGRLRIDDCHLEPV